MGLITETNEQYYQGVQAFRGAASGTLSGQKFTTTFNTDLIFGSYNPSDVNYALNNFINSFLKEMVFLIL